MVINILCSRKFLRITSDIHLVLSLINTNIIN